MKKSFKSNNKPKINQKDTKKIIRNYSILEKYEFEKYKEKVKIKVMNNYKE